MTDIFEHHQVGLQSPACHLEAGTPDDANDLPNTSRALNVAGSGFVRVTTVGGETQSVYIAAGIPFPLRATRIWATGTTATDITVMF